MPTGTISKVRQIIKAEEIVNKLQNSILGKDPTPLTQNEINTCKILLAKAIPDLKAVEHTGNIDSTQTVKHKVKFVSSK